MISKFFSEVKIMSEVGRDKALHKNIDTRIVELSREYHHGNDLIRDLKKVKLHNQCVWDSENSSLKYK